MDINPPMYHPPPQQSLTPTPHSTEVDLLGEGLDSLVSFHFCFFLGFSFSVFFHLKKSHLFFFHLLIEFSSSFLSHHSATISPILCTITTPFHSSHIPSPHPIPTVGWGTGIRGGRGRSGGAGWPEGHLWTGAVCKLRTPTRGSWGKKEGVFRNGRGGGDGKKEMSGEIEERVIKREGVEGVEGGK